MLFADFLCLFVMLNTPNELAVVPALFELLFFLAPLSGKHVLKMVQFYNAV